MYLYNCIFSNPAPNTFSSDDLPFDRRNHAVVQGFPGGPAPQVYPCVTCFSNFFANEISNQYHRGMGGNFTSIVLVNLQAQEVLRLFREGRVNRDHINTSLDRLKGNLRIFDGRIINVMKNPEEPGIFGMNVEQSYLDLSNQEMRIPNMIVQRTTELKDQVDILHYHKDIFEKIAQKTGRYDLRDIEIVPKDIDAANEITYYEVRKKMPPLPSDFTSTIANIFLVAMAALFLYRNIS